MQRPLILIHGYSANYKAFHPLRDMLEARGIDLNLINICNYISLNNEITIKDIAEGLDRAYRYDQRLNAKYNMENQEFDAIVHSTGMLVLRSWLTNYGCSVISFATRRHGRAAHCGEPTRPPVPIACNTKECRTNHNTDECRIYQHGDRQRKSNHLDHQEISEGECRKYHDHDRGGARNQACGSSQTLRDRIHFTQSAPSGFENACNQKYLVIHA